MITVLRQALQDPSWLDRLESVIYGTRYLTWPLFNFVWEQCLGVLTDCGETLAVRKLTQHYLHKDDASGHWRAHWCCASLQPGSYVGSQPQAKD